jgi:adenylylsulfate reductase subunit B
MPLGAVVQPLRSSDSIMWSIRFRNKQLKRFKFPIRTIPEGTLIPNGGFIEGSDDLKSPELRTEPESLGTDLYTK